MSKIKPQNLDQTLASKFWLFSNCNSSNFCFQLSTVFTSCWAVDSFDSLCKLSTAKSEPARDQSKVQEQEWLSDRKAFFVGGFPRLHDLNYLQTCIACPMSEMCGLGKVGGSWGSTITWVHTVKFSALRNISFFPLVSKKLSSHKFSVCFP